jgi:hypothetical protein
VLLAAAVWCVAYALELAASGDSRVLWGALKFIGTTLLPPAWLIFALQYAGRRIRPGRWLFAALAIEPALVFSLLAYPRTRSLIRSYPAGQLVATLPHRPPWGCLLDPLCLHQCARPPRERDPAAHADADLAPVLAPERRVGGRDLPAMIANLMSSKALRRAIKDVFGEHALVHRRHRHEERNITDLLPERERPAIVARIRGAWALKDPELAEQRLELLASELARTWPDAAGSLREGMDETLTLMRLKITGQLAKTLCSTNPCESMLEIVRHTQRNVKRWRDGDMRKHSAAAGMLIAEQQFRRIIGYRDLAKLVIAIERHADRVKLAEEKSVTHTHTLEAATV